MAKPAPSLKIVVTDPAGKASRLKAASVEIELGDGRRLRIDAPHRAWGDLDIEAAADAGVPVISVQPGGCNLLTLRVDAHHEMAEATTARRAPELTLSVQKAVGGASKTLLPKKAQLRQWAQAALRRDAEVAIRLVDEEEGRQLNLAYRHKDYPTNVLTFVYGDGEGLPPETGPATPLMGDLVLCVPVVAREAAEQGKALEAHYAHLVVHGMLHLQGYDHEEDDEAARMEALETEILASIGYPDPYA